MDAAAFLAIALQCATQVAPDTLTAIARHESALQPWLVHDNTTRQSVTLGGESDAVTDAKRRIAAGHSVDMGLMQVNSANLGWLGLRPEGAFEPCANVNAGARVLIKAYREAAGRVGPGGAALRMALSAYNTGNDTAGVANGYVGEVEDKATAYVVPPLTRQATGPVKAVRLVRAKNPNVEPEEQPSTSVDPFSARERGNPFARSAGVVFESERQ